MVTVIDARAMDHLESVILSRTDHLGMLEESMQSRQMPAPQRAQHSVRLPLSQRAVRPILPE